MAMVRNEVKVERRGAATRSGREVPKEEEEVDWSGWSGWSG